MAKLEPWYHLAEYSLRTPVSVWFNWHFEGSERIPREGPVLVAANHISYLDPLAHGLMLVKAGRRPRFLAKKELFDNPVLRTVLSGANQIPVERGSGSTAPVQAALDSLRAGEAVVVYPEATVTKNEDFLPMTGKTGIARLAMAARMPVLPIAVWGSQHVWQRQGARDLRFGRPIWLKAGVPLDFSSSYGEEGDLTAMRSVTASVMDELRTLALDLRSRYPARWA